MVVVNMEIHNRYLNRLLKTIGFYQKKDIVKAVKEMMDDERRRRSPINTTTIQSMHEIIQLPYDYSLLVKIALNNEVLRTIHDAIIRGIIKSGWDAKPRFLSKCPKCGTEFQTVKERCPDCNNETDEPDPDQKKILKAFIDDPNRDDEMTTIIQSLLRYALSVDDNYLSIQLANGEEARPLAVYVEDSVSMRVIADEHGVLGNGEYFCPICTGDEPSQTFSEGESCPKHPGVKLKETAYAHVDGSTIKARFARDEIIHMQVDPWLPGHYGNSKVIACLRVLLSIVSMDKWNFDLYTTGKLAQIIGLPLSQLQVNELVAEVKNQRDKMDEDPNTGMVTNKLRTLFLGVGDKGALSKVDAMPPGEKMQSLDWWKLWREVTAGIYGVTPIFAAIVESGKTGNNPGMQIDVGLDTFITYQKCVEDPFNNALLPKLGVSDWLFKFNDIRQKDAMQEITVLKTKVETVMEAAKAGFNAELTDEGEVRISGKPKPPQPLPFDPNRVFVKPEGEGQAFEGKQPFKEEEVFSQEKGEKQKRGHSYLVTDLDEHS